MSTLDINEKKTRQAAKISQPLRTALAYLLISGILIAVNYIYSLFAHGVSSAAMENMYWYTLFGGTLVFLFLGIVSMNLETHKGYRVGLNSYSAGIAALTSGGFFQGVLEIAGSDSGLLQIFRIGGWILVSFGLPGLIVACLKTGGTNERK